MLCQCSLKFRKTWTNLDGDLVPKGAICQHTDLAYAKLLEVHVKKVFPALVDDME